MNTPMYEEPQQAAQAAGGRSGPPWALIGLVVMVVVALVFVLRNRERTTIDFLFFEVDSRVWTAIAISIGIGIVLDRFILAWWRRARRRKQERS